MGARIARPASRLGRYADGVMEAAWLAAVMVVPVFFNIYSSRIFEPDKMALLRTLALVALAAWVVKIMDQRGVAVAQLPGEGPAWRRLLRVPLAAPVLGVALVLLVSTALSVVPRISFWGSYQRLQGALSTLSYLMFFTVMAANLRSREQVQRLVTTVILASLPVSLYGVLQRYQIDPVPWGGDVSTRIASNLGNSIFVGAYLIMVMPLTLARALDSFRAILDEQTRALGAHFTRSTVYVFTAALQLIALFMSGSRGPMLGWLAGSFFLFVLLSLHLPRKMRAKLPGVSLQLPSRSITLGVIGLAALLGVFLAVLNIPGGPLEGLRSTEGLGRLGRVLEIDRGTGRVRALIWQGSAELVLPHDPLDYPDGSRDGLNALRPWIGYGPESMHMAFNPFFPPELAQLEQRNASPDRAHNETWDALVTTGVLGLIAYQLLFSLTFYYGLKWLGLVQTGDQRRLFLFLVCAGGVLGAAALVVWGGAGFFGVGLPTGILMGLIAYLTLVALIPGWNPPVGSLGVRRVLLLAALLATLVAHYVEIHFGIAIAATRLYFWTFTALLLLAGHILPALDGESADSSQPVPADLPRPSSAGRRGGRRRRAAASAGWLLDLGLDRLSLVNGLLVGVLLATLGYNLINVQSGDSSVVGAIWQALTRLPNRGGAQSFGILTLFATSWLASGLVFSAEASEDHGFGWRRLGETLGISALVGVLFWLWHAGWLIRLANLALQPGVDLLAQVSLYESIVTRYLVYLALLVLLLAVVLPQEGVSHPVRSGALTNIAAPALLGLAFLGAFTFNLRAIHADIDYKLADPFSQARQWGTAIGLYQRALANAPNEDFYYLFLGKAYLESIQGMQDAGQLQAQFQEAEASLLAAQSLNPLNPDHTANLGRLYRWWASRAEDPVVRQERGEIADRFYERALALSPNNVGLWGEWASLSLSILEEPDAAFQRLAHALELDPKYDTNHALLGDYYQIISRSQDDPQARSQSLLSAARSYKAAIDLASARQTSGLLSYHIALAGVSVELENFADAIQAYQAALSLAPQAPDAWRVQEYLASVYSRMGEVDLALAYANQALAAAPEEDRERIRAMIELMQASP